MKTVIVPASDKPTILVFNGPHKVVQLPEVTGILFDVLAKHSMPGEIMEVILDELIDKGVLSVRCNDASEGL